MSREKIFISTMRYQVTAFGQGRVSNGWSENCIVDVVEIDRSISHGFITERDNHKTNFVVVHAGLSVE
jgi:hydrogenase maturation factor